MKPFLNLTLLSVMVLLSGMANAQSEGSIYRTDANYMAGIKVTMDGVEKKLAWCGGVNNPQFATPDLNHDGKNDLVIFEAYLYVNEKGIKTFINKGTAGNPDFVYDPAYEYTFPYISKFLIMQDYNCDNIPDIFHYGLSGISICDGYYNGDNMLAFKDCREIRYLYPNNTIPSNVGVGGNDIPSIVDVDNDGDLDILTFAQLGSRIELFRNQRVEKGYSCDTFALQLRDHCWGRVLQVGKREHMLNIVCDNSLLNGQPKITDGSNALCLLDHEGDGDYDALVGNSQYSDLQFLGNNRLQSAFPKLDSMTWQDTLWQSGGKQAYMPRYPLATWIDIDGDGDKDILVSPLAEQTETYKCIAFYKNMGSNSNPGFVYQSDSFLVDKMIDLGSNSYPVFYDYNRDGKKDLFVGSRGFYQPGGTFKSTIYYFQNTSTSSNISFNLVERNFLSIDTVSGQEGAALAIGDIDNDGLDDLLAGRLDGSITFYKNFASSAGAQPDWKLWQKQLRDNNATEIDAGNYAAPFIYKLNNDNTSDLIIGNETGYITYYENQGSPGQQKLVYKTNKLGDVKVEPDKTFGYSAPFIGKMDNLNIPYLVVGSGFGTIHRYTGFANGNVTTPYTLVDTLYSSIRIRGKFVAPVIEDLNGDGMYEMFVGNDKGGLFAYRQVWKVGIDDVQKEINTLEAYPNPAGNVLTVKADNNIPADAEIRVYNSMGQIVKLNKAIAANRITIDVAGLQTGIYMCTLQNNGKTVTTRFVKL